FVTFVVECNADAFGLGHDLHRVVRRGGRRVVEIVSRLQRGKCAVLKFQPRPDVDRKSTRLNSSHLVISYAVFCLKKKITSTSVPASCAKGTKYSPRRAVISLPRSSAMSNTGRFRELSKVMRLVAGPAAPAGGAR